MFKPEPATLYMDQSAWRDLQQFLPLHLLDRYLNPNAPAKIILHHGVGTDGRQLNLIVGKMQFYLAALDARVRQEDENPSIGIIVCKEKKRTIVEYAVRDARRPIGVATCEITGTLPRKLKDQLPSPEAIARLLESI